MKGRVIVIGAGGAATPVAGGATLSRPDPPSISPWKAAGFVALIVALVLAGGFAMRRSSRATAPPSDGND
jgi:hypothetical protein